MTLFQALQILARVHTRDDHLTGFCVEMGAMPEPSDCAQAEYVEAWEAVREQINLQTMPRAKAK